MPAIVKDTIETFRKATYQDVLDAPAHNIAQIVNGAFHMHARLAARHTRANSILGMMLGPPFHLGVGGPGGWRIYDEPELHLGELGEDILVPDLAGWRRGKISDPENAAHFTTVPDWVCEILSPSTRALDRGSKSDVYAREGVSHLWLLDPDARVLEALVLEGGEWRNIGAFSNDAEVSVQPFEKISVPLSELWRQ